MLFNVGYTSHLYEIVHNDDVAVGGGALGNDDAPCLAHSPLHAHHGLAKGVQLACTTQPNFIGKRVR
jgi:hypothetical protein